MIIGIPMTGCIDLYFYEWFIDLYCWNILKIIIFLYHNGSEQDSSHEEKIGEKAETEQASSQLVPL
jgi:hypothetical protein